jgi:hypothetical protein
MMYLDIHVPRPVMGCLNLFLKHVISALSLDHQRFSSRLHQSIISSTQSHQHQSCQSFSLSVSIIISDLNISEFISWTTNLRR